MISRQKKYLREIIANYFGATFDDLYAIQEVSEKTLRADIQVIQGALSKYGLAIKEDRNRLYIPFEQKEDFLNAYEEIISEDEKQMMVNEYEERKIYILTSLCKTDDYISMNILADRLYVSKSSVAMIIHDLKEEIPNLVSSASLTVSGRKGVKLNASEKEIRELLVRSFMKNTDPVLENKYFLNYLDEELKNKFDATLEIVKQFMQENNIIFADQNISKVIAHILIIAQRLKHNKFLDVDDYVDNSLYEKLSEKLSSINLYISSKELSSLPLISLNRSIIEKPVIVDIVYQFIKEINDEFKEEILRVEDAYQLIVHIDEILKKSSQTKLKEFVLDTMLQRLLSAYFLSGRLCKAIYDKLNITLDEEHRAYIAMHIQDMYRKHLIIKENMLLYDANVSECNMLKTDLEKHFGVKAEITSVYVRWDIEKKIKEKKYAIILSTQSILGMFDGIPFLKINSFLTNDDYEAINKLVYKNRPVKITKGGQIDNNYFIYENVKTLLNKEILLIDGIYVTCTTNQNLKSGVYEINYKDTRLFVINNDMKENFMTYHRLINRFGQMLKENKI